MNAQLPVLIAPVEEEPLGLIDPQRGLKRNFRLALYIIAAFIAGLFIIAFALGTKGAVIAGGQVTVESRVKKIAHPQGGVIAAVFVKEGQRVKKDQVLMRLDNTVSGVSANASGDTVERLLANIAMLSAERDGSGTIAFPPELARDPTPEKLAAMAEARHLFALRRQAVNEQLAQIGERVRQTEQQIGALESQRRATQRQSALVGPELDSLRTLRDKQLVTVNRLNQIERTAVDLEGQTAAFGAQIAQARARIAELRQSATQIVQDNRSKAGAELLENTARLNDQKIRSITASDAYQRSLVRAPYDGIVDKLAFATVGGVVPPMETIMEIVPTEDRLTVTAKVSPFDIDQITLDQPAMLRFSAFNNRVTPEIAGKVVHVSADSVTDERTGQTHYKVDVAVASGELKRLGGLRLVPGMPVEVFIQTGERSLLSYFTKPLADQFNRAFREN